MCCAIYVVGITVHFIQCAAGHNAAIVSTRNTCPQFEPLAAVGGVIWCTSNLLLVPLVDSIGVGMTMMLWGMSEMMAGWATARFGMFHLNAESVTVPWMNYCGIVLAFASLLLVMLVKPDVTEHSSAKGGPAPAAQPLNGSGESGYHELRASPAPCDQLETKWTDRLSPLQRRWFGICGSLLAGALSGSTFVAPQYVVDQTTKYVGPLIDAPFPGASTQPVVFPLHRHFCG